MALGLGSIVMLSMVSADLPANADGPDVNSQPPKFGVVVVDNQDATYDILWEQGNRTNGIAAAGITDLYPVDAATRTALWGRIVGIVGQSADYRGEIVAMYRRSAAGAAESALLAMVTTGTFREVPTAQLAAVAGR